MSNYDRRVSVRGRGRPTVEVTAEATQGATFRVDDEQNPDRWCELLLNPAQIRHLYKLCPGPRLLDWTQVTEAHREAILGVPSDGVRLTLGHFPTCYRRGKWRLCVEVFPGKNHHHWGCFDEADQPLRNFHRQTNALDEAEAIAHVLLTDRHKHGPIDGNWWPRIVGKKCTNRVDMTYTVIAYGRGLYTGSWDECGEELTKRGYVRLSEELGDVAFYMKAV